MIYYPLFKSDYSLIISLRDEIDVPEQQLSENAQSRQVRVFSYMYRYVQKQARMN